MVILFIELIACHPAASIEKQISVSSDTTKTTADSGNSPMIIDSCLRLECYFEQKKEIPQTIVEHNHLIDSVYINGVATYEGDTIYTLNSNYKLAVLKYDDHIACVYKFLLLIDTKTGINMDRVLGYADCDRDGLTQQLFDSFEVKNNSIKINHWKIPEGQERKNAKISKTETYLIKNRPHFSEGQLK
ncbi:MAG: hypothetical protein ACJ77K_06720 [Bacteroidia bacterium]